MPPNLASAPAQQSWYVLASRVPGDEGCLPAVGPETGQFVGALGTGTSSSLTRRCASSQKLTLREKRSGTGTARVVTAPSDARERVWCSCFAAANPTRDSENLSFCFSAA